MKAPLSRAKVIALVIIAFSLLAGINSYYHAFSFPDEADYWTLASNLVHKGILSLDGLHPSAYRPPMVAWLLAPLVWLRLSIETARPVFVCFYAATGILTGVLLCRMFPSSRWIPSVGTAFVLCDPLYFFSAGNLYPQQVLTPLLLAALLLASSKPLSTRTVIWRSIAVGLVTAVSVLASAPALFSLLPTFLLLVWEDYSAVRAAKIWQAYRSILAVVAMLICLVPYLVRNACKVHPGTYLSLNSGINLLFGNSPQTTPTSGIAVDISNYTKNHENDSEFDLNSHLTSMAMANIRQRPLYYWKLYLRKCVAGWTNTVETVTHGYNKPATIALLSYMILVWIGIALLVAAFFRKKVTVSFPRLSKHPLDTFTILVLAGYLLTIAGYAIFFTRLRFRIPVDIALALVSVAGWGLTSIRPRSVS